jgi:type IV secretory pathway VirB4 component
MKKPLPVFGSTTTPQPLLMEPVLSAKQDSVCSHLEKFVDEDQKHTAVIRGPSGSGKTGAIARIACEYPVSLM